MAWVARRLQTARSAAVVWQKQQQPAASAAVRMFSGAQVCRNEPHVSQRQAAPRVLTNQLKFIRPEELGTIPSYRILETDGSVINKDEFPEISKEELFKWLHIMVSLEQMDKTLVGAQRQGRVSFYMTGFGEYATHVGSAAALDTEDVVFAQYREAGVLMYRGFTIAQFMHQCLGNEHDIGKGRQMPVHYGIKEMNFHTVSSPLGTQLPQAAGAAYALKLQDQERCVIVYFGDGAASEGDAHAAMNMAATLGCPTIFFCRNNGYAISVPTSEQYKGDGIASRGAGYGMDTIRVDGNDVFAVYQAVAKAREMAVKENKPVLIEAMTYRMGHHSTSDDSKAYRAEDDVATQLGDDPIMRLKNYMKKEGLVTDEECETIKKNALLHIRQQLVESEKSKKPSIANMFTDVLDKKSVRLEKQEKMMHEHIAKYPEEYPTDQYAEHKE